MNLRRRDDRLAERMHDEFADMRGQLHAEIDRAVSVATTQLERADEAMRERESFALTQHEAALTKALDRVADALDGIGTHLQLERRDRAAQSATVEFLLRELVVAFSNPVPDGPAILGGTIDPPHTRADTTVSPTTVRDPVHVDRSDAALPVGQSVEVRSRFQRRWVGGFEIAEATVADGRAKYRIMRRLDHELLPVIFDFDDVRADGPILEPASSGEDGGAIAEEKDAAFDVRLYRS